MERGAVKPKCWGAGTDQAVLLVLRIASARSLTDRATKVLMLSPTCSAAFATKSYVGSSRYPAMRFGKPFRGLRRLLRSPLVGIDEFYPCQADGPGFQKWGTTLVHG